MTSLSPERGEEVKHEDARRKHALTRKNEPNEKVLSWG